MARRKLDLLRLFNPATDFPAIIAVLLGLSITIFLNELAIKLIGACVSILGGVALFMLFSQRLKDASLFTSKPVSETTSFKTTVKQDPATKRLIFDDYADSFGRDDFKSRASDAPATSEATEPVKDISPGSDINDMDEGFTILTPSAKASRASEPPAPVFGGTKQKPTPVAIDIDELDDFSDGNSGMRIIRSKSSSAPTPAPTETPVENIPSVPAVEQIPEKPIQEIPSAPEQPARKVSEPPAQPFIEPIEPQSTAPASGHKRKKLNIQLTEIFEEAPDTLRNEPRKEFDYLLSRVLMVIRSVITARTALFFWVNFDKEELILESKISDTAEALVARRKLPIASDVLSQIALNGTPEILTEINPSAELDLLPYYQGSASTRSFVGVPVYFNNAVVGILTADTTEEDAYDSVTVSFLGHFTKLISGLIQGYTEKYDLIQSARTLEVVETFRRLISNPRNTREDICTALIESLDTLLAYTSLGVCIYSEEHHRWYICDVRCKNDAESLMGKDVFLENSLIGKTIVTGKTAQYSNLPSGTIRITGAESSADNAISTFVPLTSSSRCYGALFIETSHITPLTQQDMEIIHMLAEYAGTSLEQMQLNDIIHSHALTDESTGVLNSAAFLNRAQEEYVRSRDMKLTFSIGLIRIEQYKSMSAGLDAGFMEITAQHVTELIQKHLRSYDILGRFEDTLFGVGLIQKNSQEAQLWAERVRKEIASSVMQFQSRQFSVTISIGIAEYSTQQSFEEVLAHAEKALTVAIGRTNSVSVFA